MVICVQTCTGKEDQASDCRRYGEEDTAGGFRIRVRGRRIGSEETTQAHSCTRTSQTESSVLDSTQRRGHGTVSLSPSVRFYLSLPTLSLPLALILIHGIYHRTMTKMMSTSFPNAKAKKRKCMWPAILNSFHFIFPHHEHYLCGNYSGRKIQLWQRRKRSSLVYLTSL